MSKPKLMVMENMTNQRIYFSSNSIDIDIV